MISAYDEGRIDYLNGVSFFNNPYFEFDEEKFKIEIQEWARGWVEEQIRYSQQKLTF